MIDVQLSFPAIVLAGNAGVMRQVNALKRNLVSKDAHHHDSMEGHVSGAIAEYALSMWLGVPWDPAVGITSARQVDGDVLNIEARSTAVPHGCLIAHDYSIDDRPYLLVRSDRAPVYGLCGWVWGHECKQQRYWRENVPRPAYFVPQRDLRPIDELPIDELPKA